jgi:hypothetical protein
MNQIARIESRKFLLKNLQTGQVWGFDGEWVGYGKDAMFYDSWDDASYAVHDVLVSECMAGIPMAELPEVVPVPFA